MQPTIGHKKRREGERGDSAGETAGAQPFRQRRYTEGSQEAKAHRHHGGQSSDDQAISEEGPIHRRNMWFNSEVVRFTSSSTRAQSGCNVRVGTASARGPSIALALTNTSTTRRLCR